jgi:hypothetical protein
MGVTITYDSVAASYDSRISAVPLNIPHETTQLYLAYRLDHHDAALDTVLDVAEAVLPTVR